MMKIGQYFLLFALVATSLAFPAEEYQFDPEETDEPAYKIYRVVRSLQPITANLEAEEYQLAPEEIAEFDSPAFELHRERRSLQPGAPNFPGPQKQKDGWSVSPDVSRDDGGNTRTNVEVNHKGDNHDFNAGWGKVVRGPGKAKPTWHVGGTYRW